MYKAVSPIPRLLLLLSKKKIGVCGAYPIRGKLALNKCRR
jgi:hypothetical protein